MLNLRVLPWIFLISVISFGCVPEPTLYIFEFRNAIVEPCYDPEIKHCSVIKGTLKTNLPDESLVRASFWRDFETPEGFPLISVYYVSTKPYRVNGGRIEFKERVIDGPALATNFQKRNPDFTEKHPEWRKLVRIVPKVKCFFFFDSTDRTTHINEKGERFQKKQPYSTRNGQGFDKFEIEHPGTFL